MLSHVRFVAFVGVILVGIWSILASTPNPPPPATNLPQNAVGQREISVVLTRQAGDPWYLYTGASADPSPGEHAVIDSLSLPGSQSYALSHGKDPNAYFVNPGENSAFRGMPVEGSWTAQFSGNRVDAPNTVQFTILRR
jgi:hypothetical protein